MLRPVLLAFCIIIGSVLVTQAAETENDVRLVVHIRWRNIDTGVLSRDDQQTAIGHIVDYIRSNLSVSTIIEKTFDSIGITPDGQMRTIARVSIRPDVDVDNTTKRDVSTAKPIGRLNINKALDQLRQNTKPIAQHILDIYDGATAILGQRRLLGYRGIRSKPEVEILLAEDIRVEAIDRRFKPQMVTGVVGKNGAVPWHLDRINQKLLPLDGQGTIPAPLLTGPSDSWIYIIDTGISASHPEFALSNGSSRVTLISNQYPSQPVDCDIHGTHVASLAAGNTVGVNPNSSIFDVRTLDCTGSAYWSDVLAAVASVLQHCTANGGAAKRSIVINMSIGGPGDPADPSAASMATELYDLRTQCDAVIVAAAGNSAASTCLTLPAGYVNPSQGGVLAVGATAANDAFAYFSNTGPCVVIDSPGVSITGASNTGGYAILSGTSMASPIVAGVASLHTKQRPTNWAASITGSVALFTDNIRNKLLADSIGVISGEPSDTTNSLVQVTSSSLDPGTPIAPITPTPLPPPAALSDAPDKPSVLWIAYIAVLFLILVVVNV